MRFEKRFAATFCGTLVLTAIVPATSVAQSIPIRDLDPARTLTYPYAIRTRDGLAIGQGVLPGATDNVPVSFDASGATPLALPSGTTWGYAYGFNRSGTIVGGANGWGPPVKSVGVEWNGGVVTELDALVNPGSTWQIYDARAIDSRGRIACDGTDGVHTHALILDNGALTDLGALPNSDSFAMAMNEEGVVGGFCEFINKGGRYHACLFRGGQVVDLHDRSFMTAEFDLIWEINRFGMAAGIYQTTSAWYDSHAFFWDGSKSVDLAPLLPPGFSQAYGVNDFGDVVGDCTSSTGSSLAFLIRGGVFVDLNTLVDPTTGWVLTGALAIDDEGRITGIGLLNGATAPWILEPDCKGTFTIYGTGCAGSGGVEPTLVGAGCPTPDRDFALALADALPNSFGLFFVGAGNGILTVRPGCDLEVLPLVPPLLPIFVDAAGEWWDAANFPAGTPTFDLYLQCLIVDPGAANGISGTKPVALHFE